MISHHDLHFSGGLGGFGGVGGGGFGGGRGRRRRGEIRGALLLLLTEEPRNGYQLMQAIEERSGGRWRPSPGSVYPTLAQLEDEGLIRAIERDANKLFELTEDGRAHVAEHHPDAPPWCVSDDPADNVYLSIRKLIQQTAKAALEVTQVGDERQIRQAQELLTETRRSLYGILAEADRD